MKTMSAQRLSELTGLTYRRLDYWCRCGVFGDDSAHGSGSRRRFTYDQAYVARLMVLWTAATHAGGGTSPSIGGAGLTTSLRRLYNDIINTGIIGEPVWLWCSPLETALVTDLRQIEQDQVSGSLIYIADDAQLLLLAGVCQNEGRPQLQGSQS